MQSIRHAGNLPRRGVKEGLLNESMTQLVDLPESSCRRRGEKAEAIPKWQLHATFLSSYVAAF
jgi:hypothetical protein